MASIPQLSTILDAASNLTWRPFHNFPPFWTPHSHPNGVRFPPPSLFGRHTSIPLASISQRPAILDATSASQWRPFHNFPRFWTPPRMPSSEVTSLSSSGRPPQMPPSQTPPRPPGVHFQSGVPPPKYRLNHNAFLIDLYFFKSII
jgi:hypothetical protein